MVPKIQQTNIPKYMKNIISQGTLLELLPQREENFKQYLIDIFLCFDFIKKSQDCILL